MKKHFMTCIALILVFAVGAASLCAVNAATKNAAADAAADAQLSALQALIPNAEQFETDEESGVMTAMDAQGEVVGYIADTTASGYDSEMAIRVACDTEGVISGVSVGGEGFAESQGLGAKALENAFTDQFAGLTAPVAVGADGIEALSAATITTNAVLRGVNDAAGRIAEFAGFGGDEAETGYEVLENGSRAITVQGFGGPVYVEISLDESEAITAIVIGDDSFAESQGLGAHAQEEAFYGQYIGKSGALVLNQDIEAISGATITSAAVNNAVNILLGSAAAAPAEPEAEPVEEETVKEETVEKETVEEETVEEAPAAEEIAAEEPVAGVEAEGTAQGLMGPVFVKIAVENDAITAIEIGDDSFKETEGLGSKALEDGFKAQFIGKSLPIALEDIDAISGATVTSQAVIDAINAAYAGIQ